MRRNSVSTQVRLSKEMYEYITKEATRLAVAKNAIITVLLEINRIKNRVPVHRLLRLA